MHCQTLPDPENTPVWSFSLSLSLPRRLGPIKAGLTCLLSLTDAIHPEGTPWILLGLDPGSFCFCNSPLPILPKIRFLSIIFLLTFSTYMIWIFHIPDLPHQVQITFSCLICPRSSCVQLLWVGGGGGRGLGLTVPGVTGKFSLG